MKNQGGFVDDEHVASLAEVTEHDYLTHLVFKLYENSSLPIGDRNRYRVELVT